MIQCYELVVIVYLTVSSDGEDWDTHRIEGIIGTVGSVIALFRHSCVLDVPVSCYHAILYQLFFF